MWSEEENREIRPRTRLLWPSAGVRRAPTQRNQCKQWPEPLKRINQPDQLALVGEARRFRRFFHKLLSRDIKSPEFKAFSISALTEEKGVTHSREFNG